MNFDWYGASVDADHAEILGEAAGWLDSHEPLPMRGRHGFAAGVAFRNVKGTALEVMWANRGAPNSTGAFVQGTGRWAYPVAEWVRRLWPVHRVARADVAEDFAGDGTWDRLSGLCLQVADKFNVKVEHAGDHHRAIEGRSYYVGGRSSVVRAICYEKGIQTGGDPTHVRVELRVRPADRAAKFLAAATTPPEFYGASNWSRELAVGLGHPDVARLSLGTVYREDDEVRSRNALLRQYAYVLRGIETECGSWSAAGEWIGKRLDSAE